MNELLRSDENLQQAIGQVRLRDPYVVIDDGVVGLTATRDVGGVDLTSTVAIRPQLEADGRIGVTVASAHVGRLSIPDALTRRFADRLAEKIEDKANSVRVRIRSLRVEAGRITIEGSTAR